VEDGAPRGVANAGGGKSEIKGNGAERFDDEREDHDRPDEMHRDDVFGQRERRARQPLAQRRQVLHRCQHDE
jgi:hypothetical protein